MDRHQVFRGRPDEGTNHDLNCMFIIDARVSFELNINQTHNVALVSPIARFVVSLGLDGRIVSQGTFSDVLATDRNLALEMASELATSKIPEDAVQLEANPKQQEGKLIAAEEIAQGRVGWQACQLAELSSQLAGN